MAENYYQDRANKEGKPVYVGPDNLNGGPHWVYPETAPTPKGIVEALARKAAKYACCAMNDGLTASVGTQNSIAETFAPVEKLIEAAHEMYEANQSLWMIRTASAKQSGRMTPTLRWSGQC